MITTPASANAAYFGPEVPAEVAAESVLVGVVLLDAFHDHARFFRCQEGRGPGVVGQHPESEESR